MYFYNIALNEKDATEYFWGIAENDTKEEV